MLLQSGDDSYPYIDIMFLDNKAGLKWKLCDCVFLGVWAGRWEPKWYRNVLPFSGALHIVRETNR